ncbi:hypothetical protein JYU34_006579 [Plutella xylostella]|uniref:Hexosyltransferase n=1 Tax=Plutella xylostella TaxID=51655 RepID=A0ABQ7QSB9_PLUXY|nr:hypothetical protein JYU34_006579 [Plutella xylostella]
MLQVSGILKISLGVFMCMYVVNAGVRRVRSRGAVTAGQLYQESFKHARPELCARGGFEHHALLLISSAPEQYGTRMLQRARWAHLQPHHKLAFSFFIGTPEDDSMQQTIDHEADLWRDVIQGNSVDSYRNSTLKVFSIFEWILDYCPVVPLLIKADDDSHINTTKLFELLPNMMKVKRTIWGKVIENGKPQRDRFQENFVPQWVYPYDSFPTYVVSKTFVMTTDIVYEMMLAGLRARILPLPTALLPGLFNAAGAGRPVTLLDDPSFIRY